MPENELKDLVIRDAAVRRVDLGFILAGDPKLEEAGVEHTIAYRWKAGVLHRGDAKFTAHSCCIIDDPEYGVVKMAASGVYSVETRAGVQTGNIFNDSVPPSAEPRYGDIRCVASVSRKAYAAGLGGIVYRLDKIGRWTRIDEGLSTSFDIEDIDGFQADDVYAVGDQGEVWQLDSEGWHRRDVPTNRNLNAVKCGGDGVVYAGGHDGILIRGRADRWEVVHQGVPEATIWDIEWFNDTLYLSTMSGVFSLTGDQVIEVEFGEDVPTSTYRLSVAEDVLWSIGERDVMRFDGEAWQRIV